MKTHRPLGSDGSMAALVHAFPWATTPLGAMESWPQALRTAVDICLSSPVPMFVWWGPHLINIYNDAYAPLLGRRHPAALGMPAREVWADIWPQIAADVDGVVSRGVPVVKERVRFVMERNGYPEETFFTYSHSPIPDGSGGIGGLFQVCTDETERVRAEVAIREGEARLRALATASRAVQYHLSADWSELQPLDGKGLVPSNDAPTQDWLERNVHAADQAAVRERIAHCIATKTPFEMEHRVNRPDGEVGWTHSRAVPLLDESGRIAEWVGTAEDVTERRTAEEKLRESEERFRLTADLVPQIVWITDADGRALYFNRRWAEYTGVPYEPTTAGDVAARFVHPDDAAATKAAFDTARRTGTTLSVEHRIRSAAGEYRWFLVRGEPYRSPQTGRITRWFGASTDIHDRRMAEERSWTILESINDAFYAVDADFRFTYVNQKAEQLWGRRRSELIGRHLWTEFPQAVGSDAYQMHLKVMAERTPAQLETVSQVLGRWIDVSIYPEAGGGLSCYFRDVTERKRAEEARRMVESRFQRLVEHSPQSTQLFWPDGRPRQVNRAFTRLFGITLDQLQDYNILRDPELVRLGAMPLMERAFAGEAVMIDPIPYVPDRGQYAGRTRWAGAYVYPVKDDAGKIEEVVLVHSDVTEQKQAEQALRESERRLRQMADTMPQMVWVTRPDGYHEYYNHRWYEFTGVPEGSTDGEGWNGMFHPDDQERAWTAWRHSLATGEPYEVEYRLRHRSGEYRWTLGRALPVRNAAGEITNWFGTCTDIDGIKRLQQEREVLLGREKEARAEAERQSRLKDEFLATLSHELRTPLNAILGWSQVLRTGRTLQDPEEVGEGLEVIERNARAQTKIIEDLLEMSRVLAGKVRLDVQRILLAPVVEAAVETVRPAAEAKGVRLQIALDPLAGPVGGDPARLQQVFWNLLSNSVKHSTRGGRVQVLLERVNSHLEVSVIDEGEGIEPSFLPYVFDRFRQADSSTTRHHGGLGLGLSIVKQLVELHGGRVSAESHGPGKGATFTVTLPLTPVLAEPPEATPPEERRHPTAGVNAGTATEARAKLSGLRVLVVDDEPDARALVQRVLENCHAVVTTAASAAEALEAVRRERPDVLVSDIGMPAEDGYTLIKKIRALSATEGGDVPAVALTAYARSEDRTRALVAGFSGHVAKPVEPAELVATVAALSRGNHRP